MLISAEFLSNMFARVPYDLAPRRALPGDVFDRRVDSIASTPGSPPEEIEHPFQLYQAGVNTYSVRYGTVNNVTPTLGGTSLSSAPTAALTTTGTYKIYLEVNYSDAGVVSSVTVESTTGALPAYDDNTDYIILGEIDVTSSVIDEIRQAVTHSLMHGICGRTFVAGPTIDEPGTPYFWGV